VRVQPGSQVVVTKALVEEKVNSMLKKEDLSKFIL
jgi:ATP-dependent protease HslVU (ClpYQ) ATPase subunit